MMSDVSYETAVFINCPFDNEYRDIFDAIVYTVMDCGFRPRCALERDDSGRIRLDRLFEIVRDCRFGIHDLSRTQLDRENQLPRFNMPFELGIFLAAQRFGTGKQKQKVALILDRDRYRYQKFLSDIAGQDIRDHGDGLAEVIRVTRDWLRSHLDRPIPGGTAIEARYRKFRSEIPELCDRLSLDDTEVVFADYTHLIALWLRANT